MKADIFFVVTTIAVLVLTGVVAWALMYLIKILRNVEDISETVKKETKKISQDIEGLRDHVRNNGIVPNFIMRWIGRSSRKKQGRMRDQSKK